MDNRKNLKLLFLVLLSFPGFLAACSAPVATPGSTAQPATTVEYRNSDYGFSFSLPSSWAGYSIVTSKWQGFTSGGPQGDVVVEEGPLISIRHPQWTSENPRQDIPIMVFTLAQWDSLQQGNFLVSPAPVGPSELGSTAQYVFALPARYNYAFLTGFEEVETILDGKPLHTP